MAYFGLEIRDSQESTAAQISKVTGGFSHWRYFAISCKTHMWPAEVKIYDAAH